MAAKTQGAELIRFYDFPMAPSPRRARIILAEKNIPHASIIVDLAAREQQGAAYAAINPRMTVPALQLEDGTVLTDNAGIAAWAEAHQPTPPLMGTTPLEKADIASWNARIEQEGFLALAEAMRNSAPAMKDRALPGPHNYAQIPELALRGTQRFTTFIAMLDQHLADREYIAAGTFSLADITAVVAVDFARVIRMKPAETHSHIGRWRAAMARRPSMAL
ncbi:MAG: glutathione S-transferase family protein [Sphingopyxis sp.]